MREPPQMTARAIGWVRSEITQLRHGGWEEMVSEIVIDEALSPALDGLEDFSHIIVVFWMNQLAPRPAALKVRPRRDPSLPLVGHLVTRSPYRPTPLGVSVVRLLERQGNVIRVQGLDAISGTPVIDIKPYLPDNDAFPEATVAEWVTHSHRLRRHLEQVYDRLWARYGPQHWWPAESAFEMMVGAILTQSAAWRNVERAIAALKDAGALSPAAIRRLSRDELAQIIHASGYHNAKARKLKVLADWLGEAYGDDTGRFAGRRDDELRRELLALHGIGPETADSILLYAAARAVFVIDAYTRRILSRLGLAAEGASYDTFQGLFMDNLPRDAALYNEYHALLVRLAKEVCRPAPRCADCCLAGICPSRVSR
jgi:endonuclease-3 related protein